MFHHTRINNTSVLCRRRGLKELHKKWEHADIVVLFDEYYTRQTYKKLKMSNSDTKLEVYQYDKSSWYISGFDDDQDLLNHPIKAVLIFQESVIIFIYNTALICKPCQVKEECLETTFYSSKQYIENEDVPNKKQKKNTKIESPERMESQESRYSEEIDEKSFMSDDSFANNKIATVLDDDEDTYSDVQYECLEDVVPIISSKHDEVLKKKMELAGYRKKLEELFAGPFISSKQQIVSVSELHCHREISEDDPKLKYIADSVKYGSSTDTDGITVVSDNHKFSVLSGTMRVKALQIHGINTVTVNYINSQDARVFTLRKFFKEHISKEPEISETMEAILIMLNYLELTPKSVLAWKEIEIKTVFDKFIGLKTKIGQIFLLTLHENLCDSMKQLIKKDIYLSSRAITEIVSRHKINPEATSEIISNICVDEFCEKTFRKKLLTITPDAATLLRKKRVEHSVIERLLHEFGDDQQFIDFVRSGDLRKRNNSDQFIKIQRQFLAYKQKTVTSYRSPIDVSVSNESSIATIYLSSNIELAKRWIVDNVTDTYRIAIVFGTFCIGASGHQIITLPKDFAIIKENDCKSLYMKTSIFVSINGRVQSPEQMSDFCDSVGIDYCDLYSLEEFSALVKTTDIVYIGGFLNTEFAAKLSANASSVLVSSEKEKQRFEAIYRRRENKTQKTE